MTPAAAALRTTVIGVLAVIAGCVLLGNALVSAWHDARPVRIYPHADGRFDAREVALPNVRRARVALILEPAQGTAAAARGQEAAPPATGNAVNLPYRVSVRDRDNHPIATYGTEGDANAAPDLVAASEPGTGLVWIARYPRFELPPDGRLRIIPELLRPPAATDGAVVMALEVRPQSDDATVAVVAGVFLFLGGWVTAVTGVGRRLVTRPANSGTSIDPARARRRAQACHLAGLCGLALPVIGHLLPTLWLWRRHRADDPFIDRHGLAALNFQLSLLCWFLLAFSLVLAVIGLAMLPLLYLLHLVAAPAAVRAARRGEDYRYPLTFRFVTPPVRGNEVKP